MTHAIDPVDVQAGITFLSAYSERMESLMKRLEEKPLRQEVVGDYKKLKSDLESDVKRLTKLESTGNATHVQQAFLLPATREAKIDLRPATNSNPFNSDWCGALFAACGIITYYLAQLKR